MQQTFLINNSTAALKSIFVLHLFRTNITHTKTITCSTQTKNVVAQ